MHGRWPTLRACLAKPSRSQRGGHESSACTEQHGARRLGPGIPEREGSSSPEVCARRARQPERKTNGQIPTRPQLPHLWPTRLPHPPLPRSPTCPGHDARGLQGPRHRASTTTTRAATNRRARPMTRSWGGSRATRARAMLAPMVAAGVAVCRRCGEPIAPGERWDVGHLDDLALGGHVDGRVSAEHERCNRSAGGQLGAQLRRDRSSRTRTWLARFFRAGTREEPLTPPFSPPSLRRFPSKSSISKLIYEVHA